ncbi:MAG TPA: LysR substrate-binding domain-containing protein [Sphingomonas sp.]|nr:LysR substrate-binding domain-containing protein [Sphingomonas sp.]
MTLEQLRIFVTVAERLNMTRAAEALHLTQSAVSAAVAALETRHATRLFDRVGRGLALSEAGRAFLPEARAVLARAAEAEALLDDLAGLRRGSLRIAASQTVASYWLPSRIARFGAAHPGVAVAFEAMNTAQVAAAVLAGEAELGFVEGRVVEPALAQRRVGGDRLGLYVGIDDPLAGRALAPADLPRLAWALRERGSGTRDHFERTLEGFGIPADTLDVRLELPSNEAVLGAIEAGGLVAAVSALAAGPHYAAGRIGRIDLALPPRDFTLLVHGDRRRSRAGEAFLAELDEAAKLSHR